MSRARPGCPSARHRRSRRQTAGGVQRGRSWPRFRRGVSGAARAQFERAWHDLQRELAVLSIDSIHVVVEGAGHSTLQTDQKDAQVTSAAITKVVEAVRTHQPLTR